MVDLSEALRIDAIQIPGSTGWIGMCSCPGKDAIAGTEFRSLREDLQVIQAWGAGGVMSLIERHEFAMLAVEDLPATTKEMGMWWRHLPIPDMSVPRADFEERWQKEGMRLHRILMNGGRFVLHCYAGLGRTGMIAARLIVEAGLPPKVAIDMVRQARAQTIQTREQEKYVKQIQPLW